MQKKTIGSLLCLILVVALGAPSGARQTDDDHSENMHLLGSAELVGATDVVVTKDGYAVVAVNGASESAGLWTVNVRNPSNPQPVGHLGCAGSGYDIGMWRNIVVMSIDSASGNSSTKDVGCNLQGSEGKEGIRLVDISDRRNPREVAFVETQCGSHTNITFEHDGRGLVYVQSYPASTSGACPSAHGIISVVDITIPAEPEIVSTPSVVPAVGCHDGVVRGDLAYMACLTEGQVWDVSDPTQPVIIAEIHDVADAIWHSVALSNDGKTAIFGFESFGPGNLSCLGAPAGASYGGALWFYDVSDPTAPQQLGHFAPPRLIQGLCTAHNFSVVPKKDVVVTAWYAGGVMAIDFSDPAAPVEMAHYVVGSGTSTWDANWQRGYAFVGDGNRGLDIYKIDGLSPAKP